MARWFGRMGMIFGMTGALLACDNASPTVQPAAESSALTLIGHKTHTLRGPKGDKGDVGPQGAQGEQGPQGEKGDAYVPGEEATNEAVAAMVLKTVAGSVETLTAFEVISFDFGLEQTTALGSASTGAGAGKAELERVVMTLPYSKDIALLAKMAASGAHADKLTLTTRDGGSKIVDFNLVFVESFELVPGKNASQRPLAKVTFAVGALSVQGSGACDATPRFQIANVGNVDGDAIEVIAHKLALKNVTTIGSASGGAGGGKLVIDPVELTTELDDSTACRINKLMLGGFSPTLATIETLDASDEVVQRTVLHCGMSQKARIHSERDGRILVDWSYLAGAYTMSFFSFDEDGNPTGQSDASWNVLTNSTNVSCPTP